MGEITLFPLHLISNQPKDKPHSQVDHGDSKAKKFVGREPMHIHPDYAAARGLKTGDLARLFNDRGACLGGAVIDDALCPGVVQMSMGAWYDPDAYGLCKAGNPNVLTRER